MRYLVGTDEAGYGPNLGPLVIAATAWELPDELPAEGMYQAVKKAISANCCQRKLTIADSKIIYKPGGTLEGLERGVLTALTLLERRAATWREVWPLLDPNCDVLHLLPWHDEYDEPLPVHIARKDLDRLCRVVAACLTQAGIKIVDTQAAVLFPGPYNGLVDHHGNKAEVLSLTTLNLARRVILRLPPGKAQIICDRHGGRAHYAALLQHIFPDELVRVKHEDRVTGIYELQCDGREIEFQFLVRGERMLPTALASMTAKYLRELAMRPFNGFWQKHVADLKPTAGYFGDARRFYDDIRAAKERLAIEDRIVWRER